MYRRPFDSESSAALVSRLVSRARLIWVRWGRNILALATISGWMLALTLATRDPSPADHQQLLTTDTGRTKEPLLSTLVRLVPPSSIVSPVSAASEPHSSALAPSSSSLGSACCRAWDDVASTCRAVCSGATLPPAVDTICVKGASRALVDWTDGRLRAMLVTHCAQAVGAAACSVRPASRTGLLEVAWTGAGPTRSRLVISSVNVAETPRCGSATPPDLTTGGTVANIVLIADPRVLALEQQKKPPPQGEEPADRARSTLRHTQRLLHVLAGSAPTVSDLASRLLLLPEDLLLAQPQASARLLASFLGVDVGAAAASMEGSPVPPAASSIKALAADETIARIETDISDAGVSVARLLLQGPERSAAAAASSQLLLAALKPSTPLRIALISVADVGSQARYASHFATVRCYALRHGYAHLLLTGDEWQQDASGYKHPPYTHFFFRKHASVASVAWSRRNDFDWFVVLDGDVMVMNSTTPIERYLRTDPNSLQDDDDDAAHVIHYERMHNGEVMAGNAAYRSRSAFALDYLRGWAALDSRMPRGGGNFDNGALHPYILSRGIMLTDAQTTKRTERCSNMWYKNTGDWVTCAKCAIFFAVDADLPATATAAAAAGSSDSLQGRSFGGWDPRIALHRRAGSFCRDFFITHPGGRDGDVFDNMGSLVLGDPMPMLHGWKDPLSHFFVAAERANAEACAAGDALASARPPLYPIPAAQDLSTSDPYQLAWQPSLTVSMADGQQRLRRRDELVALGNRGNAARAGVLRVADVAHCWPNCPPLRTRKDMDAIRLHCEQVHP